VKFKYLKMAFKMKEENRKRMKKIALALGAITFAIIILAFYKLFIVR